MNREVIKNIIIISLILGVVLGGLAPIPYVGMVMLWLALIFSAPVVMVYLIMDSKFDVAEIKDSIIAGAIVGFCTNITFSIVYSLIMVVLLIGFNFTTNYFLTAMISNAPVWMLIMFIIFMGVLFATTNAFSGLATYYVINYIRDVYERNNPR